MSADIKKLIETLEKQGKIEEIAAVLRRTPAYGGKKSLEILLEEVNWELIQQQQEEILENQGR